VLVAVQRGGGAWGLQTVDVHSGEVQQIVEIGRDLWDAALDPAATAAYWLTSGESPTGGVWRMDLATGEIRRVLDGDPVARSGIVLAAGVQPLGQLAVSDDGHLAVLECYHACRLRLVDLLAGTHEDYPAPADVGQQLIGFVPAGIAFWGGCIELPIGTVTHARCPDPDGRLVALEAELAMGFGVELPSGWSLEVVPVPDAPIMSFDSMALARSETTSEVVRLRVLGTLHGQG
jgi:hypothetical protein